MTDITHIGLDVHKDSIAVAVLRPGATEVDERVIPNTPEAIRRLFRRYRDPSLLSTCYEAGPTDYDTHRLITSLGIECDVIAPSMIPRRSGARVKTDRIDARNLARLHRAGELTNVRVPSSAEEAARDLIRVREEVKSDRRIARQRIRSFLMRYGKRYPGSSDKWSVRFEVWMRALRFDEPLAQEAYEQLVGAYFVRDAQLAEMGRRIEKLATEEPFAEGVALLGALRGIGTLSAMTILAETCDFYRFPDAKSYMGFTGLMPSEHSSGASRHQGSITKTKEPAHTSRTRGIGLGLPARACRTRETEESSRGTVTRRRGLLVGRAVPTARHVSAALGEEGSAHRCRGHRP